MKKKAVWGAIVASVFATSAIIGVDALHRYSTQEAMNILATGTTEGNLHQYSTQEAANLLVQTVFSSVERPNILPTVTFVWDDNVRELWSGTDSLLINATGNIKMSIKDIFKTFDVDGGLAFETQSVRAEYTGVNLTIAQVRDMITNGWECGTVGWDEIGALYHGNISFLANGYTAAQVDTFYNNVHRGMIAQRDTLGLGMPRWISHSNASGAWITNQAAARSGIEFGFQSSQTATAASGDGTRPNELYPLDAARWGQWGTGGAGGLPVAAIPQQRLTRYEIRQGLGENSDSSACYKTIRHAMQTRGLVVFIGHRASTWETAIEGQNGFYKFMQYIDTLRDAGRIQILVPSEAADYYFNTPLSPVANILPGCFSDLDGDTHYDWWFSGNGLSLAASDTAFLNLKPASFNRGNSRSASLGWTGEGNGSAGAIWANQTGDAPWESAKACIGTIPPAGGGWTAQFEVWAICDTTVAGWTAGAAPQAGDTMGVSFGAPFEQYTNRWGTGTPGLSWITSTGGTYVPQASHPIFANTNAPGNLFKFTSRNNFHGKKEWLHIVATYEVPEFADYLLISIWKTAQAPSNGIIISDYSLTYYRRGPYYN